MEQKARKGSVTIFELNSDRLVRAFHEKSNARSAIEPRTSLAKSCSAKIRCVKKCWHYLTSFILISSICDKRILALAYTDQCQECAIWRLVEVLLVHKLDRASLSTA